MRDDPGKRRLVSPDLTIYSYQYADRTDVIDPANQARINRFKYRKLW